MFKIEKNIPAPKTDIDSAFRRKVNKYKKVIDKLKVGESVLLPLEVEYLYLTSEAINKTFRRKKFEDGIRYWRVK